MNKLLKILVMSFVFVILFVSCTKKPLTLDDEMIKTMDDLDSHANGSESISLAVVGLDDLNPDEFEYDPFSEKQVDILITSDIVARRVTTNYGNEFLSDKSIDVDKLATTLGGGGHKKASGFENNMDIGEILEISKKYIKE